MLILDIARLRLQEAIIVLERSNPSSAELATMRSALKELVERLNRPFRPLPLSPLQSLAALLAVGVLPSSGP